MNRQSDSLGPDGGLMSIVAPVYNEAECMVKELW